MKVQAQKQLPQQAVFQAQTKRSFLTQLTGQANQTVTRTGGIAFYVDSNEINNDDFNKALTDEQKVSLTKIKHQRAYINSNQQSHTVQMLHHHSQKSQQSFGSSTAAGTTLGTASGVTNPERRPHQAGRHKIQLSHPVVSGSDLVNGTKLVDAQVFADQNVLVSERGSSLVAITNLSAGGCDNTTNIHHQTKIGSGAFAMNHHGHSKSLVAHQARQNKSAPSQNHRDKDQTQVPIVPRTLQNQRYPTNDRRSHHMVSYANSGSFGAIMNSLSNKDTTIVQSQVASVTNNNVGNLPHNYYYQNSGINQQNNGKQQQFDENPSHQSQQNVSSSLPILSSSQSRGTRRGTEKTPNTTAIGNSSTPTQQMQENRYNNHESGANVAACIVNNQQNCDQTEEDSLCCENRNNVHRILARRSERVNSNRRNSSLRQQISLAANQGGVQQNQHLDVSQVYSNQSMDLSTQQNTTIYSQTEQNNTEPAQPRQRTSAAFNLPPLSPSKQRANLQNQISMYQQKQSQNINQLPSQPQLIQHTSDSSGNPSQKGGIQLYRSTKVHQGSREKGDSNPDGGLKRNQILTQQIHKSKASLTASGDFNEENAQNTNPAHSAAIAARGGNVVASNRLYSAKAVKEGGSKAPMKNQKIKRQLKTQDKPNAKQNVLTSATTGQEIVCKKLQKPHAQEKLIQKFISQPQPHQRSNAIASNQTLAEKYQATPVTPILQPYQNQQSNHNQKLLKTQEVVMQAGSKAGPTITPTKPMRKTWHGKPQPSHPAPAAHLILSKQVLPKLPILPSQSMQQDQKFKFDSGNILTQSPQSQSPSLILMNESNYIAVGTGLNSDPSAINNQNPFFSNITGSNNVRAKSQFSSGPNIIVDTASGSHSSASDYGVSSQNSQQKEYMLCGKSDVVKEQQPNQVKFPIGKIQSNQQTNTNSGVVKMEEANAALSDYHNARMIISRPKKSNQNVNGQVYHNRKQKSSNIQIYDSQEKQKRITLEMRNNKSKLKQQIAAGNAPIQNSQLQNRTPNPSQQQIPTSESLEQHEQKVNTKTNLTCSSSQSQNSNPVDNQTLNNPTVDHTKDSSLQIQEQSPQNMMILEQDKPLCLPEPQEAIKEIFDSSTKLQLPKESNEVDSNQMKPPMASPQKTNKNPNHRFQSVRRDESEQSHGQQRTTSLTNLQNSSSQGAMAQAPLERQRSIQDIKKKTLKAQSNNDITGIGKVGQLKTNKTKTAGSKACSSINDQNKISYQNSGENPPQSVLIRADEINEQISAYNEQEQESFQQTEIKSDMLAEQSQNEENLESYQDEEGFAGAGLNGEDKCHNMGFELDKELQNVRRCDLLGEGTFGKVYTGLYNGAIGRIPPQMAVKVVQVEDKSSLYRIYQECELLKTLDHPNIVKYYGCTKDEAKNEASIFMELMPHSLISMMETIGPMNEIIIRKHIVYILKALNYLHKHDKRIIHGDLKAANVLFDGFQVKLTDFGDSRIMGAQIPNLTVSHSGMQFRDIKGSILWMAPEIIREKPIGTRSDIWSLGQLMLELATGKHPWPGLQDLGDLFSKLEAEVLPEIPEHLSADCKDFITKCLTYDKDSRPSAKKLLEHPFVCPAGSTVDASPSVTSMR